MPVLLIATLDTKGAEAAFVRDRLRDAGLGVVVVDAGVQGPPGCPADISREEVYAAADTSFEAVRDAGDRGRAVEAAARGVAKLARDRHARGEVEGVFGLG